MTLAETETKKMLYLRLSKKEAAAVLVADMCRKEMDFRNISAGEPFGLIRKMFESTKEKPYGSFGILIRTDVDEIQKARITRQTDKELADQTGRVFIPLEHCLNRSEIGEVEEVFGDFDSYPVPAGCGYDTEAGMGFNHALLSGDFGVDIFLRCVSWHGYDFFFYWEN